MMLKIDVYGVRHWIADVDRVEDVLHFEVPNGVKAEDEGSAIDDALEKLEQHHRDRIRRHSSDRIVYVNHVPLGGLTNVVLLRVWRRTEDTCDGFSGERLEHWYFPKGCGFLMERGQTVDRI